MIQNRERDKKKLVKLVECIAGSNDLDEFLKAENLCHFKRHIKEVEKLYRSGLFLKMEIGSMLSQDFNELIALNKKLKNRNIMSAELFKIDQIH